jgi:hypothetical protein
VLALYDRKQIAALFDYLKAIIPEELYREFEERNLPPAILAERRAAEAAKRQAEENEKRTIRQGNVPAVTHADLLNPPRWRNLGPPSREEIEKQEQERRTAIEAIPIPEPEF